MRTDDLDFALPEELIALHPPAERAGARLMVARRDDPPLEHRTIRDLPELLAPGDLLVFNETKVVPARLEGRKPTGGRVDGLWLQARPDGRAEVMLSGGRLREGVEVELGDATILLVERLGRGRWVVENLGGEEWLALLARVGATPLPPYILSRRAEAERDSETDRARYQTLFARSDGAVAAPTAALHFDEQLLGALASRGVNRTAVTLHVGPGTFQPIECDQLEEHTMHAELFAASTDALDAIDAARKSGGRVIAVGTTVCRTLEHLAQQIDISDPGTWSEEKLVGSTSLFIKPGHRFGLTDGLLTNFHLPKSTLIALVAAFAGSLDRVLDAYRAAIAERYHFYSYGDATLWL